MLDLSEEGIARAFMQTYADLPLLSRSILERLYLRHRGMDDPISQRLADAIEQERARRPK